MTETAPAGPSRDTLLLSHANPEDNEFHAMAGAAIGE
jgi:hypothetical protein